MKGLILNLVEDVVRAEHGEDYWDQVVDASGLAASYTSMGTYPDHEVEALAAVVAAQEDASAYDVIRHVGHVGMASLAERYPGFFDPHTGVRPFLLSLNTTVHPEVRRLYPGAVIPEFDIAFPDAHVVMTYRDPVESIPSGASLISLSSASGWDSATITAFLVPGVTQGAALAFLEDAAADVVRRLSGQRFLMLVNAGGADSAGSEQTTKRNAVCRNALTFSMGQLNNGFIA